MKIEKVYYNNKYTGFHWRIAHVKYLFILLLFICNSHVFANDEIVINTSCSQVKYYEYISTSGRVESDYSGESSDWIEFNYIKSEYRPYPDNDYIHYFVFVVDENLDIYDRYQEFVIYGSSGLEIFIMVKQLGRIGGEAIATPDVICSGSVTTIKLSDYSGSVQWQTNTSGSWVDIPEATNSAYQTSALTSSVSYRAVVDGGKCESSISTVATVTVKSPSIGGIATAALSSICSGSSTSVKLADYNGSIQWQTNASGSWIDISGATSDIYYTPDLTLPTSYRAIVTNGDCAAAISSSAQIKITTTPLNDNFENPVHISSLPVP